MSIKIGINGFGRMGRLVLRAAWDWPELEFIHINATPVSKTPTGRAVTWSSKPAAR